MKRIHRLITALVICVALTGCGPEVELDFSFPSTEAFVRTQTIQLIAVPVSAAANPCPELVREAQVGGINNPAFRTQEINVCVLHSGSITVSQVPDGRLAYIAIGRGPATSIEGQTTLTACTIHDIYEAAGPVRLVLSPAPGLLEQLGVSDTPSGCVIDDYCSTGCAQ